MPSVAQGEGTCLERGIWVPALRIFSAFYLITVYYRNSPVSVAFPHIVQGVCVCT